MSLLKNIRSFSFIYFAVGFLDLFFTWSYPDFRWISKPLILIFLIIHFYSNSSASWDLVKKVFLVGLVFALIGDVFLLFSAPIFFLFGLSSFLIMQLLYSFAFFKNSFRPSRPKYLYALGLFVVLYVFISKIWENLDSFQIPVLIYTLVIVGMAIYAAFRQSNLKGYWLVVTGAVLFMISDGFIAWNKFQEPLEFGGLVVMFTYILAQYFIATGLLKSFHSDYRK